MPAMTLTDLVAQISAGFGAYASGAATVAGSTTTLIDSTNRIEPDSTHVNRYVRFTSGANAGQERLVTAFVRSSATVTLAPALANATAQSDSYEISPLRKQMVVDAIERAVRRAGRKWMVVKLDESGSFSPTAQDYDLPPDCVAVLNVWINMQLSGGTISEWAPWTRFDVQGPIGARVLSMRGWAADMNIPSNYTYQRKLEYLAMPTIPAASGDTLGFDEQAEREMVEFVTEYALYLLHQQSMATNRTGDDARVHNTLMQQHMQQAMQIEQGRKMERPSARQMRTWRPGRQRA